MWDLSSNTFFHWFARCRMNLEFKKLTNNAETKKGTIFTLVHDFPCHSHSIPEFIALNVSWPLSCQVLYFISSWLHLLWSVSSGLLCLLIKWNHVLVTEDILDKTYLCFVNFYGFSSPLQNFSWWISIGKIIHRI